MMPVMSPRGPSDEVVQKVFDDVFSLLQIKYKISERSRTYLSECQGIKGSRGLIS